MFIIKNNYYLYIENTNDININKIKKNKKISIVYRNKKNPETTENLVIFRSFWPLYLILRQTLYGLLTLVVKNNDQIIRKKWVLSVKKWDSVEN